MRFLIAAALIVAALSGCSVVAATALAPIIGQVAEPIVEGIVAGIEEGAKPPAAP